MSRVLFPCLLVAARLVDAQVGSAVVISQVYGGGGNVGATLTNDFIELFNRGAASADLTGWTLQYASATGSSWSRTNLSGRIEPGQYYLVEEGRGNGGIIRLPRADAVGAIAMSATAGKVALVRTSILLTGTGVGNGDVVDFVGYGGANASLGRPAPELSNTAAAVRFNNGCSDSRDNARDFVARPPAPRNTSSTRSPCVAIPPPAPEPPIITGVVNAASQLPGPVAPGTVIVVRGARLGPDQPVEGQRTPDGGFATRLLAETRVLVDGAAAPVLRTSSSSVLAIIPFGIVGSPFTEIQVEYKNQQSGKIAVPVVEATPAVFTLDDTGASQAAAWNEDATQNTKDTPSTRGATITLLATGCGPTTPSVSDGQVVRGPLPKVLMPVRVLVGGIEAAVISATAAPDLPAGYVRLVARVPAELDYGGPVPVAIQVGEAVSQYGVTVALAGSALEPGTGALIETSLAQLRSAPSEFPVTEIPDDVSALPRERLAIVSWNVQTGGASPDRQRLKLVEDALHKLYAGTYQVLAAQEVPNQESAEALRSALPGGPGLWRTSFVDTTDAMDNGVWYRTGVTVRDSFALFSAFERDESGKPKSLHPPHVANMVAGDFDFTLISVHLTNADGDARESARELKHVLDYLDRYFSQPDHDPDVLVCGDFNIASSQSQDEAPFSIHLDRIIESDPRFQSGERRFVATVTSGTSRRTLQNGGVPNRNLDHCVVSADALEELIQVRRVDPEILLGHPEDPEERLTSDHFPIAAFFRMRGERVARDNRPAIRPQ